jgi:hypothetical protein
LAVLYVLGRALDKVTDRALSGGAMVLAARLGIGESPVLEVALAPGLDDTEEADLQWVKLHVRNVGRRFTTFTRPAIEARADAHIRGAVHRLAWETSSGPREILTIPRTTPRAPFHASIPFVLRSLTDGPIRPADDHRAVHLRSGVTYLTEIQFLTQQRAAVELPPGEHEVRVVVTSSGEATGEIRVIVRVPDVTDPHPIRLHAMA